MCIKQKIIQSALEWYYSSSTQVVEQLRVDNVHKAEGGIFKQEWFKQWYDPTAPPEYDETSKDVLSWPDIYGAELIYGVVAS
jgi:hypothetical protein